jgi:ribonuclease P protein component
MLGLPKRPKKRLSRSELEHLFRKGRKFRHSEFPLTYLVNQRPSCRFSVIVSKKVNPKAVDRNKVRRRIYEILRTNIHIFPQNIDLAINIRIDVRPTSYHQLQDQLLKILHHVFPGGKGQESKP